MQATIHNMKQKTAEWFKLRSQHDTASEAPAALGVSKYQTRTALLKQKATGLTDDVDSAKQALFDRGNAAEESARALAEDLIGEDLFPITATLTVDGMPLLASLDGATMDGSIIWEHKLFSASLAADIQAGTLDPHYTVQMDQQLLVTGAEKCLFMISDGTQANMAYVWYQTGQKETDALIAGWKQFHTDLGTFTPTAPTVQAVAAPVESLPAVSVRLDGQLVVASNLPEFGVALKAFIANIPTKPDTDQQFADCEAACKALKKAEEALEGAETHALAQMTDVEAMRRVVADLRTLARSTRLASEKVVASRKEQIRTEIVQKGRADYHEHVAGVNGLFGASYIGIVQPDFAGAIKGKKSIDSLRSAVADTLANAKSEVNSTAMTITKNLRTLNEKPEFSFLFADVPTLVLKAPDDLAAVVQNRISHHQAKEAARIEADRARIANEERIKAEAEARKRADAEIAAATAAAQAEAASAKAIAQDAITAAQATPVPTKAPAQPIPSTVRPASAMPTLKLGMIAERLGFTLSADFIASLGFEPAMRVKSSCLYHESQFNDICAELVNHINSVCALQEAA